MSEPLYTEPVVDAHHHLWDLQRGRYPWLQEEYDPKSFFLGDYAAFCHDFLPDDYRAASRPCNVVATVHVEAERDRAEQVAETEWLHEMNARYGMPNAVVGHVWLDRPETEERLLSAPPLSAGARHPQQAGDEPRPRRKRARSARDDARREMAARPRAVAEARSELGPARPGVASAGSGRGSRDIPRPPIVLNHHGFAWDRSEEGLRRWRGWLETIARQPNVHVKVSEFCVRDRPGTGRRTAGSSAKPSAVFGWQRSMFASNFPVSGLRIDYPGLVTGVARALDALTADHRQAVMCDNALKFYRIAPPANAG